MRKNRLRACWAIPVGMLLAIPAAGANTVFLAAEDDSAPLGMLTVEEGDSVTLDLRIDFLDTTVGGGVALRLDPTRLRLDAVTFDPGLGDDSPLRCVPPSTGPPAVACPADPDAIGFGTLTGLAGNRLVATLELTALSSGTSNPGVAPAQAFSDVTGRPLDVVYLPEPGRLTLLAAGIGQLLLLHHWRSRRRRSG